jgi:hypothetical protein
MIFSLKIKFFFAENFERAFGVFGKDLDEQNLMEFIW